MKKLFILLTVFYFSTGDYRLEAQTDKIFKISSGCFPLGDDYPYAYDSECNSVFVPDVWNMYIGQCTSWVSWKINQVSGYSSLTGYHPFTNNAVFGNSLTLGNAVDWKDALLAYYPINDTPSQGSIGWYRDHTTDSDGGGGISGHVTFITCVIGNLVTLTEYNFTACKYDSRIVDISLPFEAGNRTPDSYIHIEVEGFSVPSAIKQIPTIENSVTVYPNPSSGIINISIDETITTDSVRIVISNMMGQEILSLPTNNSNIYTCDLSDKPNGIYFVNLYSHSGLESTIRRIAILR